MTEVPMGAADIAANMIRALEAVEPELDTSIGSPTRKILDVVAEQIAPAYAEAHLLQYVFDLDSKSGDALDDFCAMFSIYRFPARRATGVITFKRNTAADQNYTIPTHTQVVTPTVPQIVFATVAPAILQRGTTSVDVPIQAVVGGESGNLPANSLTRLVTPMDGVLGTLDHGTPTSGGLNAESDDALKERFKRTVFRSLAGTRDMYLATALEDTTLDNPNDTVANQANVIGASVRWREQVQIAADGTAVSTAPAENIKYVFPGSAFFGADIDSGDMLSEGVHYTFDATVKPPRVVGIGGHLVEGTIYELDYEYTPTSSRNDPASGIVNRVDVWCSGEAAIQATETFYFRSTAPFDTTAGSAMNRTNFVRQDTNNVRPTAGNFFQRLGFGPIVTFPDALVIGGVTYLKGTHYWVVHDDTAFGYGPTSRFGLEWLSTSALTENAQVVLSGDDAYTYNRIPRDVEERIRRWSLVTDDARAHAAKRVLLRLNFAIMFDPTYTQAFVTEALDQELAQFLGRISFAGVVQVSDLLHVAHSVQGVDNVRFLNSNEAFSTDGSYAIERMATDGTRISFVTSDTTPARATDLVLSENEVPVLHSVRLWSRAQNTFREA